jgi:integrase
MNVAAGAAPEAAFAVAAQPNARGRNSVVECQLPKLDVEGSNPFARFRRQEMTPVASWRLALPTPQRPKRYGTGRLPLPLLPRVDNRDTECRPWTAFRHQVGHLFAPRAPSWSPCHGRLIIRRGKNKGKLLAKVRKEIKHQLHRSGLERVLIYRFMMMTGLRKGEVASLPVEAVTLDAEQPCVHIQGKHAKSGRSAVLPLRPDLAAALRRHLARRDRDAGGNGLLFHVPSNFTRVFDADLKAAGIPKTDAHGRTLDIHCLRHTFATRLARNGTSPAIAQKLMRHSDIRLTMNLYTHLDLADAAGAVAALPAI